MVIEIRKVIAKDKKKLEMKLTHTEEVLFPGSGGASESF
jgi:hypothetical protein